MQQKTLYLEKTSAALENLQSVTADLTASIDSEIVQQQALKNTVSTLKSKLRTKAERIEDIIKTLNGALK